MPITRLRMRKRRKRKIDLMRLLGARFAIFAILIFLIISSGCVFHQVPKKWQSTSSHSPGLYFRIDTDKDEFLRGENVRMTITLVNENNQDETLCGSHDPAWVVMAINSKNQTVDYIPKIVLTVLSSIKINASSELFITNWTWEQTKYDSLHDTYSTIEEGGNINFMHHGKGSQNTMFQFTGGKRSG